MKSKLMSLSCAVIMVLPVLLHAMPTEIPRTADMLASTVLGVKNAYVMLSPKAIGDSIDRVDWSPSGRYLLTESSARLSAKEVESAFQTGEAVKNPAFLVSRLSAYDRLTKKTTLLASTPVPQEESIVWFAGADVGLRFIRDDVFENGVPVDFRNRIQWVFPTMGTVRDIEVSKDYSHAVTANDSYPYVALISRRERVSKVIVLNEKGQTVFSHESPGAEVAWYDGGKYLALLPSEPPRGSPVLITTFDATQGKWTEKRSVPLDFDKIYVESTVTPPEIEVVGVASKESEEKDVGEFFLLGNDKDERSRASICSHGSWAKLSPKADAVAYLVRGVAQFREIAKVDKKAYFAMKDAAERTKIMNQAKQVGLAFIMYGADYDDMLPPNSSAWQDSVNPYARNREMLNQFVYTFGGGDLSSVEKPAETEMGYITGPNGRAVVYIDGHVRWIPNSLTPPALTYSLLEPNLK